MSVNWEIWLLANTSDSDISSSIDICILGVKIIQCFSQHTSEKLCLSIIKFGKRNTFAIGKWLIIYLWGKLIPDQVENIFIWELSSFIYLISLFYIPKFPLESLFWHHLWDTYVFAVNYNVKIFASTLCFILFYNFFCTLVLYPPPLQETTLNRTNNKTNVYRIYTESHVPCFYLFDWLGSEFNKFNWHFYSRKIVEWVEKPCCNVSKMAL